MTVTVAVTVTVTVIMIVIVIVIGIVRETEIRTVTGIVTGVVTVTEITPGPLPLLTFEDVLLPPSGHPTSMLATGVTTDRMQMWVVSSTTVIFPHGTLHAAMPSGTDWTG